MTSQQKKLYDFIRGEIAKSGICPSYEGMATHMGLASKSGIHRLILCLERQKKIRRDPGRARCIEIVRENARPDNRTIAAIVNNAREINRLMSITSDAWLAKRVTALATFIEVSLAHDNVSA